MVENGPDDTIKVLEDVTSKRKKKTNAATGASAAGVRALGSQAIAFYFRAPVKAFFRTRVDYLAYARAINPRVQAQESWSIRLSTPGLLAHAVQTHGWSFIPNHVLPPLIANVGVGAILYTSYLQILGLLHSPSSQSVKRVYPPPLPTETFLAGAAAGSISTIAAAVPDALSVRFKTSEMLGGKYSSMWQYSFQKAREIGPRGILAGFGLNCTKEALGCGLFFSTFEYVKGQCFYRFVTFYYGSMRGDPLSAILRPKIDASGSVDLIKPHYAIEPAFLALAGIAASFAQQVVAHPISRVQDIHYRSIESIDRAVRARHTGERPTSFKGAYQRTLDVCASRARKVGGWRPWLYQGFWWNTIRQVPSTAAGLVIFELVRKRYGSEAEAVKIEEDGYDILLP